MKRALSWCAILVLVCWSAAALARPGGGQTFGGGSSRSSGGGSSGYSGSPSRSGGGGSSWGSRSPSYDSSPSRTPSYNSPSYSSPSDRSSGYTPSSAQSEELQRTLDDARCVQQCMQPSDPAKSAECERDCKSKKAAERRAAAEERARNEAPPPDKPMSLVLAPVLVGLAFFGFIGVAFLWRQRSDRGWATALFSSGDAWAGLSTDIAPAPRRPDLRPRFTSVAQALRLLRASDEEFSTVLFEDFLHALYVQAHTLRGQGKLDRLAPYASDEAMGVLRAAAAESVSTIIVGAMVTEDVRGDEKARRVSVRVRFTSNYTERSGGADQSYYVEETWTLSRSLDVRSRPPERARVIDCPNCGAPLEDLVAGKCKYCGVATKSGDHDWRVERIRTDSREPRGPMLTGTTEEVGTDLPTVVDPEVKAHYRALTERDPGFGWNAFCQRINVVFGRFYQAWSVQDLQSVRPFLSDNLFESQVYWVAAYQEARLRNVAADARVVTVQLARVISDKHYDAITVRIYATCLDYTVDETGLVVGGSKIRPRQFSEYWTFIRGTASTGAPKAEDTCPNCGASAAEINMAGHCGKCGVKITNGAFDWVLSRIEQDEVYGV